MSVDDLAYPRVVFERTALKSVICQLLFDPLLRIAEAVPAAFQEEIRGAYPRFEGQTAQAIEIRMGGLSETSSFPPLPVPEGTKWLFKSEDEEWIASLSAKHVGLETTQHRRFTEFMERFGPVFQAFKATYPAVTEFTRIGLRYVNLFDEEQFPGGAPAARLNSALAGPFADEALGASVDSARQQFVLAEDDWTVTVRHGSDKDGYRLDLDHATTSRTSVDAVDETLHSFSDRIYQVFRWAISEEMFNGMGPEPST